MFDVRAQLLSQKGSVLFQLSFSIKVTGANYLDAPVVHSPPPASLRLQQRRLLVLTSCSTISAAATSKNNLFKYLKYVCV